MSGKAAFSILHSIVKYFKFPAFTAIFLFLLFFLTAGTVSAQDQTTALDSAVAITQITAGAITAGFGIWHFFVPGLYGWQSYFDDDPPELFKAVRAVNFFFSSSLTLMGVNTVLLSILFPESREVNTAWLWIMSGLWTARSIYQLISPQGSATRGLAEGMAVAFIVTDLAFLFCAVARTWF